MKNMLVSCTLFLSGLVAYAAEEVNLSRYPRSTNHVKRELQRDASS
jgi:hypothetical protein